MMCNYLILLKASSWTNRLNHISQFIHSNLFNLLLSTWSWYIFKLLWKVEAIKKISEYVAQLRRVGKGHGKFISNCTCNILRIIHHLVTKSSNFLGISGVWHFDQMLLNEEAAVWSLGALSFSYVMSLLWLFGYRITDISCYKHLSRC